MTGESIRSFGGRALALAAIWIALAGWDVRYWPFAVLVVVSAAYASMRTIPPGSVAIDPGGAVRFVPFFVLQSVRGGLDVARRAVRISPDLEPGTVRFKTRLPPGASRSFFAAVIGLLPGTLTAALHDSDLDIHVLDRRNDVEAQLRALEQRVGDLFVG